MKTVYKTGDVDTMVSEAAAELKDCSFIIFGADDERFEEIVKKFHKSLPDAKKIGSTGIMFRPEGSMEAGLVAMGFTDDDAEVLVGTLRKTGECPIKYMPGLIWSAEEISKKYKDNICIEFSTGNEERIVSTMKVALETVGMRLVGGTSGNFSGGQHRVAFNGKVMTDCTVYATIGSKMGKIEVYKENLFHMRKKNHVITKVSEDNRTVIEIDNRRAVDVYKEELGYLDSELQDGIYNNPLSRVVGDDNYIVAIKEFNPDGSITTYKNLQKNDMICFTDLDGDFKQYIKNNMNGISSNNNVAGIVSVNCILRHLFFEEKNFTKEYAGIMNDTANGNHMGIVGDGEQYIEQHVNQTMVCAIFTRDK